MSKKNYEYIAIWCLLIVLIILYFGLLFKQNQIRQDKISDILDRDNLKLVCDEYEHQEELDIANKRLSSVAKEWKEHICDDVNDSECLHINEEYKKALKLRAELDYGGCIRYAIVKK